MNDRKQTLIEVFEDTQRYCSDDPSLKAAIKKMRDGTVLYGAEEMPVLSAGLPERRGEVRVTKHRTFEAAMALKKEFPDKKVTVLNFASASNPGGGVRNGAGAQEECLCRCSTLYMSLNTRQMWQSYYDVNRAAGDVLHTDACIYSPGVVICKTDENVPERLKPEDFVTVDVISCAAPNLREKPANIHNRESGSAVRITPVKLYELHLKRAKHILHIAAKEGAELLVLGAFGCGAFRNDPQTVAKAYRDALAEYRKYFDVIEFAVFCREHETQNYDAFRMTIR